MPFTVFRFIHLEEFWPITAPSIAPCTAHEQYSTFVIVVSKREKEKKETLRGAYFRRGLYFLLFEGDNSRNSV